MPEQGNYRRGISGLYCLAEFIQAVLADKLAAPPGAVADKIHPAFYLLDCGLRQLQVEVVCQKGDDRFSVIQALLPGEANKQHVIHIPHIMGHLELALDKVIHWVEVDERIDLTQQIADGYPNRAIIGGEHHHYLNQGRIFYLALDQPLQNSPVDPVEKLAHIELQGVAVSVVRLQHLLGVFAGLVGSHTNTAGERGVDKGAVKNRVDLPVNRMLHHAILKGRGMDDSLFGLMHHKLEIWARAITPGPQSLAHGLQVGAQAFLKLVAGPLMPLATASVQISLIQIFLAENPSK